jgi:hypothetical protein
MKKYYTYRIGWTDLDLYYYGVRTANKWQPEDDFWVQYFTSSPSVSVLREQFGEPDFREIRKRFDTRLAAKRWESRVIQYIGTQNPNYINGKTRDFYVKWTK